ncbi:MAG: hypothetical protein ABRQ26_13395 [Syntrophomonadaceae bacterium]
MSNFFDKIKQGVSDTGAKAKIAMDVQRLKQQISSKVKDQNGKYFEIGKLTYEAFKADDFSSFSNQLEGLCNEVTAIQGEIDALQQNITELESQDIGAAPGEPAAAPAPQAPTPTPQAAAPQVNVAPPQPEAAPAPTAPQTATCACGAVVPPGSKFCQECGSKI